MTTTTSHPHTVIVAREARGNCSFIPTEPDGAIGIDGDGNLLGLCDKPPTHLVTTRYGDEGLLCDEHTELVRNCEQCQPLWEALDSIETLELRRQVRQLKHTVADLTRQLQER